MTALELVGVVVLVIIAFALPALGQSIQGQMENNHEDLDAHTLAKLDRDADQ